ncbi:uncharacterized protein TRIVIDRAFT_179915 [Trichoderma virens Gv29-8]|uniref:Monooxygenase n=1 Tax=Hypocrea virens (strain Gv29-8 / FGSC 10586) TaxID=413071 RepID=G9MR70_HYPVG|nr:uncharacterized protein TRIVIDRAFT_179915 [Trichoderma virens Gv29-8]EHK22596.1 hypothetical protein TRIVIDRAFT_179915 [Trichoderma virens Gv29-8]
MSDKPTYSQFACIGTGFSGIALGCTAKRWYGISDIRFFEKNSDLGGTWLVNQYPGCACDIPSLLYSLSFAPNPEWSSPLPSQQEIWQYLNKVAIQYGLREKMTFNSTVEKCEWIEQTSRWRITVRDNASDTTFVHESQFLFSAAGVLVHPRKPDLPNIESFNGPILHAAQWRHDVDLTDKKVAVIGNGCAAAQIVPAIKDQVKHVTQFARSKHWITPPMPTPNVKLFQWLFKNVPGVLAFCRFAVFLICEKNMTGFLMTKAGAAHRSFLTAKATKYIEETAPEKYHGMLIPDFEIGCKRRINDMGYLASLHSDSVTLRTDAIEEVTPTGIRSKDGFTEADVIVLATGFDSNSFCTNIDMVGRGGVTAEEHWNSLGGPAAYHSTSLSGFPNFFIILGPNTLTGHTSTLMAIENAVNYSLRLIQPILQGNAMAVDVKIDAEKEYVDQIQTDLKGTVFYSGCSSWYTRARNGAVHNAMAYPYSQPYFWYQSLFPAYKDFKYDVAKNSPHQQVWRRAIRYFFYAAASLSSLSLMVSGTKNMWDLASYVPFLQNQASVFGNGLAAYVKLHSN